MIDSHAHLNFEDFEEDCASVIKRSFDNGMEAIIIPGSNFETSKKGVELANKYENIYAAIGLHPIHAHEEKFEYKKFKNLARNEKVVAIGETGLDFYRSPKLKIKSEKLKIKEKQKEVFLKHLELANELNLPVILHCRGSEENSLDAYLEMLSVVSNKLLVNKGVIHCFLANYETAKKFLDLGFYIGFTGIITFTPLEILTKGKADVSSVLSLTGFTPFRDKSLTGFTKDKNLLEAVEKIPLEKILVETDSPYLAPNPFRGKRCEPWYVLFTLRKISEIKKIKFEKVIEQTTKNAKNLFKI